MICDVRYYSKGGHTKILADAVYYAISLIEEDAKTTTVMLDKYTDILFLGASVYAGSPEPEVLNFLRYNRDMIGKLVVFSTSAFGKSAFPRIKKEADRLGIDIDSDHFYCRGPFLFKNRNRPDSSDIAAIKSFVRRKI